MQENKMIKCPNCGVEIDVDGLLYQQLKQDLEIKNRELREQLQREFEQKNAQNEKLKQDLESKNQSFLKEKEAFENRLKEATQNALKMEKEKLQKEIKEQMQDEQKEAFESLKKELQEKSNQVKELNSAKIEIENLKLKNLEMEGQIKADLTKEFSEKMLLEQEKIRKNLEVENALKLKEKEMTIERMKEQIKEAQRKAELGSQQLQGEVQELAIEEYLRFAYPLDNIEEIGKGVRGGDCVQMVNTREFQNCGIIYYESKRTQNFSKEWIEKLKGDMREKGADIGVIVTSAMPKDMKRLGIVDGIWICSFDEFKGLSCVLRESMIKIYFAKKSNENRTDKMGMLYDYLVSEDFKMRIEAIVMGFTQMENDLQKEKRAMSKIWAEREKQIKKVFDNTISMYGSIKGIAGNSVGNIKALELPYLED